MLVANSCLHDIVDLIDSFKLDLIPVLEILAYEQLSERVNCPYVFVSGMKLNEVRILENLCCHPFLKTMML